MPIRRPIGWSRNPSHFVYRSRAALLAALGALVCVFTGAEMDGFAGRPTILVPAAFIACGVLALIGSNTRWRSAPWLVSVNMLIAIFGVLLPSVFFGIVRPAISNSTAVPIGWALTLIATSLAGLISDEWLASAQTLRRLGFYGRRVRRSFFGLSPRRGRGSSARGRS